MAKKPMYGPQVIIETNDYFNTPEKAQEWINNMVSHIKEKYPNAYIDTNTFYMEK